MKLHYGGVSMEYDRETGRVDRAKMILVTDGELKLLARIKRSRHFNLSVALCNGFASTMFILTLASGYSTRNAAIGAMNMLCSFMCFNLLLKSGTNYTRLVEAIKGISVLRFSTSYIDTDDDDDSVTHVYTDGVVDD